MAKLSPYRIYAKVSRKNFISDRQSTLQNGKTKKGGGVCIYIDSKFSKYCQVLQECSTSNEGIAILTISLRKPGLKIMNIYVLYKPPKSTSKKVVNYLKSISALIMPQNIELWILGDFNTDFLVRDNDSTKKLTSYLRSIGFYQLINQITRPGIHKGTCIDWILTNSPFVKYSGSS